MKKKILFFIILFGIIALTQTINASILPNPTIGAPYSNAVSNLEIIYAAVTPSAAGIVYVKKGATGNGSSWANATGEVADALLAAASNTAIKQIWAAAGTYYPLYIAGNGTTDRNKGFVLVEGVKIYGGFAGTETTTEARTLSSANASILSGNIGDASTNSDNVYHVVIGIDLTDSVAMDGFTISGGNADSYSSPQYGIYDLLGYVGGGVHLVLARPSFTNMIFCNNSSIYYGGAFFANATNAFTLSNCLFSGNIAAKGGGIACFNGSNSALTNVTMAGNMDSLGGAALYNDGSTISMKNCMVYGNSSGISTGGSNPSFNIAYSLIQGMTANAANHNLDGSSAVSFVNAPSYTTAPYSGGDFTLRSDSAGIDSGSNGLFSGLTSLSKDAAGNLRVYNYSDVNAIDIGAYEYHGLNTDGIMYVNANAAGSGTGSSWMNAVTNLGEALRMAKTLNSTTAGTVKQIWVAGGTYYPKYAADFSSTDNRDKAFVLVKDVKLYGGFAGTETALTDRNLALSVNKTILSGDLGTADDYSDNAYHVMVASSDMGTAAVDGVTIMKGSTGIGSSTNTLSINGNDVIRFGGGGIIFHNASPAVNNVIICGNQAIAGAGLYFNNSSPDITNCVISGNYASISGNGNGGGLFAYQSAPVFVNSVFAGNNAAGWGGAFVLSTSTIIFYNSIIYGNGTSTPAWTISGSYTLQYSMLQGAAENLTNHNPAATDPLFVSPNVYSNAPSIGGNYALTTNSPLINKGSNSLYTGLDSNTKDLAGNPRVFNYASAGIIDMGAYESQVVPLVISAGAQTNVSCNGGSNGSATVNVTGGTVNYSYSWNTTPVQTIATASNLTAGTYTVTVTDALNTIKTLQFTITEPTALTITPSQTDATCSGSATGSASVNVTGGTGTYSYSWNTSPVQTTAAVSNLTAGTYTVTIKDANNCSAVQPFTITEPTVLSVTPSQTNAVCSGSATGSASVNVTGGTGTYSYSWNTSPVQTAAAVSNLTAGTYTVTIKDANNCSAVQPFTITEPTALSVTPSQTNATCNGSATGSASVNVTGGTGTYSYSWNTAPVQTAAAVSNLTAGTYTVTIKDANNCSAVQPFTITEPTALSVTPSQTNATCNGSATGSASVNVTGGTGTYSYSWNTAPVQTAAAVSNLTAGTYTVTIKDANSCSAVQPFTITEPAALTITPSQTDATCNGSATGSASVNVTGGTGTYSYSWNTAPVQTAIAVSNLTAGTYTVTIKDANSCSAVQPFTITEPTALSVTPSQTNATCNGSATGSASVNVTGGTGTYSYSWNTSPVQTAAAVSNLTTGTYTVTIKDANNCSAVQPFTITEPTVLSVTPSQTNATCNGSATGSASVNVIGGTGTYSYSWNTTPVQTTAAVSNLTAGTYTVTIKDANSCSAVQPFTITEPTVLSVIPSQSNAVCNGSATGLASVNAIGGTGTYSYSWNTTPVQTTAAVSNLTAGAYTVTIKDVNNCSTAQSFTITEPDALTVVKSQNNVSCYNGTNGSASVNVTGGTGSYTYSWASSGGNSNTATGLTAGSYTVTITDANSCTTTETIVILQPGEPVSLNTSAVSNITFNSSVLSGIVSSDGINNDKGECLIQTGFVYALHSMPLITDHKINTGSTLGTYSSSISGLKGNTTYYVRTYAVNADGFINYGNEISFTTNKYILYITAAAGQSKVYGNSDPVLNYTVSGFVNGDTNSVITGALSRVIGENTGKYAIIPGSITAGPDYAITFTGAPFEIVKADQIITWNQSLEFGCTTDDEVTLIASSSSGLPISYTIANPAMGSISGSDLQIINSGSTSITAYQNGDQNHNPATVVIKLLEVSQSGLIAQKWEDVLFFNNKSTNFTFWQWYKNGNAVNGATRQYYSENEPLNGSYYVIGTDKEGNLIKSCPLDLTGATFSKRIKVYPNPVKQLSEFTFECDFTESQLSGAQITISDLTGKLLETISNVRNKNQITAPIQSAVYIIMLKLSNGEQKTINLLVK